MNSFTKKTLVALGIAALGVAANAQFTSGGNVDATLTEVKAQLAAGRSIEAIAEAALNAGVSASVLTTALLAAGQGGADVVSGVVGASCSITPKKVDGSCGSTSIGSVINAATAGGVSTAVAQGAAVAGGASVSDVFTSTAAGGGNDGGGTGAGGGSSFGSSAGSTFGGGGGGGASRS